MSMEANRKNRVIIFALILILGCCKIYAQNNDINKSPSSVLKSYTEKKMNNRTNWDVALQRSKSGDAYQFMALRRDFGFINEMIYSNDFSLIENGMILIDNIIASAETSSSIEGNKTNRDRFKGWISQNENNEYYKEVALYESYSFFYITQFLYILKNTGWVDESENNRKWWSETRDFVEENVWCKWEERSKVLKNKEYWYFLRQRIHMGSHWAGIAMYLGEMTEDKEIKKQTKEVQRQYDMLLKRNLKNVNNAYIWNSTYDDVTGTNAQGANKPIIQDVSHGNHVVAYIIAAHEFGSPNWTKNDITKLVNTLKNVVYDKQKNIFRDNVDGTVNASRPGWGNFIADGWVKLASYDTDVRKILDEFGKTDKLTKHYQSLQYEASMFKSNQSKK